ncbi:MAG: CrcB family protein [Kiritimatiellae bacterium]|jgi:CrcB protein|nr:CrcB family protein [Kiritimatiellia bacterium]
MHTLTSFLLVGCGGFVGSALRYAVTLLGHRVSLFYPHGTLWANIGGCLLLGVLTALAGRSETLTPQVRLMLATGLCGGFTTMSSFTQEVIFFIERTAYLHAAAYMAATLLCCMGSFCVGLYGVLLVTRG